MYQLYSHNGFQLADTLVALECERPGFGHSTLVFVDPSRAGEVARALSRGPEYEYVVISEGARIRARYEHGDLVGEFPEYPYADPEPEDLRLWESIVV